METALSGEVEVCLACGIPPAVCHCRTESQQLRALSVHLAALGQKYARQGDFSRARALLERAVALSAATPTALEAVGLCALAMGDAKAALHAWRRSHRLNKDTRVQKWIAAIEAGDIREALVSYSKALTCAKAHEFKEALRLVELTLEKLQGFQPALRLRVIVLTGLGEHDAALQASREIFEQSRDTSVTHSFREAIPLSSGSHRLVRDGAPRKRRVVFFVATVAFAVFLIGTVKYGLKIRTPTPIAPAQDPSQEQLPNSVVLRLTLEGESDSLAELIHMTRSDFRWNVVAEKKAESILWTAGWRHYRTGRNALRRHSFLSAIDELRIAVKYGRGAFFEDDALYVLSGALAQINDTIEARSVARQILERFPQSMFANSTTRRLAAMQEN